MFFLDSWGGKNQLVLFMWNLWENVKFGDKSKANVQNKSPKKRNLKEFLVLCILCPLGLNSAISGNEKQICSAEWK